MSIPHEIGTCAVCKKAPVHYTEDGHPGLHECWSCRSGRLAAQRPTAAYGATCQHGQLERSCEVCELEGRIDELEAEQTELTINLIEARGLLQEAREALRGVMPYVEARHEQRFEYVCDHDEYCHCDAEAQSIAAATRPTSRSAATSRPTGPPRAYRGPIDGRVR